MGGVVIDENAPYCNRYYSRMNRSYPINLGSNFEGIPENLLINVVMWVLMLILFTVIRRLAWDYGRLALVSRQEDRWTSFFFADKSEERNNYHASQISMDAHIHSNDTGLRWIVSFFKLKDENYKRKSGRDAVQYLKFQRYLIGYTGLICLVSLAIIMPVNYQGTSEPENNPFGRSTISNLKQDSPALWVHSLMAFTFLISGIMLMRKFSLHVQYENSQDPSRTLMIYYIPKEHCFKNIMQQFFREAYPELVVEDIQFAFNVANLIDMDDQRKRARDGRIASIALQEKTDQAPMMVPYQCGRVACCCQSCGCQEVEAIPFYAEEESLLEGECKKQRERVFEDCLGITFVTFQTEDMANRVHLDYQFIHCRGPKIKDTSLTQKLGAMNWDVRLAPEPEDIRWKNLATPPFTWWMKAILINGILIVLLFFLTTPTILLSEMDIVETRGNLTVGSDQYSTMVVQFLPTLMLWFFSAILPWIVYHSDQFVGHWTKAVEHHTIMRKTFIFLLLMVVILPSLGLASAQAFVEYTFTQEGQQINWGCIFMPSNAAFFVNYVITAAFIGTGLQLLRFPELCQYAMKMLAARSAYEQSAVRRAVLWEFQFGQEYAWMLCVFAVTVIYSIPCPLVTPFGLIYLVGKHLVDRHNLYFAYKPSKISRDVHSSAINYVIVALIILQFNMLFFNILKSSAYDKSLPVFSGIVVGLALLFFLGRLLFGWFKAYLPAKYKKFANQEDEEFVSPSSTRQPYIPKILLQREHDGLINEDEGSHLSDSHVASHEGTPTTSPHHTPKNYGGTAIGQEPPLDLRLQEDRPQSANSVTSAGGRVKGRMEQSDQSDEYSEDGSMRSDGYSGEDVR